MAETERGPDAGGEPAPELAIDQQSVQAGAVIHVRLRGPAGGVAEADLVPIVPGGEPAREGGASDR